MDLAYDLVIPFPGVHPEELKTGTQTKTYTQIFTTALFTIAKNCKQPNWPLTNEWMKRVGHLHTVECDSVLIMSYNRDGP